MCAWCVYLEARPAERSCVKNDWHDDQSTAYMHQFVQQMTYTFVSIASSLMLLVYRKALFEMFIDFMQIV